jgi:hypothetical protein
MGNLFGRPWKKIFKIFYRAHQLRQPSKIKTKTYQEPATSFSPLLH